MIQTVVTDTDWQTCRIAVPVDQIGYVTAVLEAYDNHFLIRTRTRGVGVVCIWYPVVFRGVLEEILCDMAAVIPLTRAGEEPGMAEMDEIYPG